MNPNLSKPPSFYLNFHTADPKAGLAFFTALGLSQITSYCDDKTKAFRLPAPNDRICLMIHAHDRFKDFIRPGSQITDATLSTESLFSIAVESKEEVDDWVSKATKAGGTADPYTLKDYGAECGMYTRSFADLDGHLWEVVTMTTTCEGQGGEKAESS
ncbi:Fc.00g057160.m01.CDS01 [Cosmosporella sp. VM-42]